MPLHLNLTANTHADLLQRIEQAVGLRFARQAHSPDAQTGPTPQPVQTSQPAGATPEPDAGQGAVYTGKKRGRKPLPAGQAPLAAVPATGEPNSGSGSTENSTPFAVGSVQPAPPAPATPTYPQGTTATPAGFLDPFAPQPAGQPEALTLEIVQAKFLELKNKHGIQPVMKILADHGLTGARGSIKLLTPEQFPSAYASACEALNAETA